MLKSKLLLICLVVNVMPIIAQDTLIPKIIPPPPNAAALEKFTSQPVDYSTGVPSISYPLYSWQRGKLQFSMGLSYHAGGHKVDDMPPSTGLGWALTGVCKVTRTVRGVPDDEIVKGYMYLPVVPAASTGSYSNDWVYTDPSFATQGAFSTTIAINAYNAGYYDTIKNIAENKLDGEQDIYSYSLNGASGTFIISKQLQIIPLEYTNVKIEMICNPTFPVTGSAGKIIAFKITDDKGVVYMCDILQTQGTSTYADTQTIEGYSWSTTGATWLASKIIDPVTKDSIVFNYSSLTGGTYETNFSENDTYSLETVTDNILLPHFAEQSDVNSFSVVGGDDSSPSSIVFPDSSSISFDYKFTREDLASSKALTDITIKDYQHNAVKRFAFKYSYFPASGPGDYWPPWAVSGNDFNKRLRLDSAIEISADSLLFKPTVFTYDTTKLNPRSSRNIDFWGYNVNPARNNMKRVPQIPLEPGEIIASGGYSAYWEGANRSPDSQYVKAAVLTRIKYPTGGFVNFDYECNQAFNAINYYENKMSTNSPEWNPADFGNSYTITLSGRTDTLVDFFFQTQEFITPRPEPDPGAPLPCFEESQDLQTTRMEINSTDGLFSTYYEDLYENFLSGIHTVINLPLGKTYRIRFVYDTTRTCSFIYRFKATMTGSYYIALQNKLAGGLRVKKITFNDGVNNVLTKQYEYNDSSGHSTATISAVPDFTYHRPSVSTLGAELLHARQISRSSNPINTLNYYNGAPLIYTKVTERESDGSSTERSYDQIIYSSNGGSGYFPYLPTQMFSNLSGMMTRETVKDKNGVIKTDKTIHYHKFINQLSDVYNKNLKAASIASSVNYPAVYYVADKYFMYITRAEADTQVNNTYEGASTLTSTESRTYDVSRYYLRTTETTNSRNEKRAQQISYAFDAVGSPYTTMAANNMVNYVVQKMQYVPNQLNATLNTSQTNYQLYQSSTLPMPGTIQTSLSGKVLQTDITFNDYDDKGNLLQYTAKDGVVTSFVYGYKKQYPVAKIVGRSYSDAVSSSSLNLSVVDRPSSDAAMRTELNKLRSLTGCLVSTYTYKPLVGMTSETDPNGRTIYYQYDAFNRVSLIRDKDNYIVKKFCYNYQGQPVDCGNDTLAAWTAISSSCQQSGGLNTGLMTVIEKNMNPSSGTYNQTRSITITNSLGCPVCNSGNCTGDDKKCINGNCATGLRVVTSVVANHTTHLWDVTYHYLWMEDCSTSSNFTFSTASPPSLNSISCP